MTTHNITIAVTKRSASDWFAEAHGWPRVACGTAETEADAVDAVLKQVSDDLRRWVRSGRVTFPLTLVIEKAGVDDWTKRKEAP